MASPVPLRTDFDAGALRREARRSRDAAQARQLLALALALALATIYDGGSRSKAARVAASRSRSFGEEDQETVRWTVSPTNGRSGSMRKGRRG